MSSTSKTLPTQKIKKKKEKKREVLSVDYLNSVNFWAKLEETNNFECIITICIYYSVQFIICNVIHRCGFHVL